MSVDRLAQAMPDRVGRRIEAVKHRAITERRRLAPDVHRQLASGEPAKKSPGLGQGFDRAAVSPQPRCRSLDQSMRA